MHQLIHFLTSRIILLGIIAFFGTMLSAVYARAQEITEESQAVTSEEPSFERPRLYGIKRATNPLRWFSGATQPLFRLARRSALGQLGGTPEDSREFGLKASMDSMGGGSGFGLELAPFHRDLLGLGIEVEAPLLYTYKRYEEYRFNLRAPLLKEGEISRLQFDFSSAYQSRPTDRFFGIGNNSPEDHETRFRSVTREAGAGFSSDLDTYSQVSLRLMYRSIGITRPNGATSAQDVFSAIHVPALFSGADLLTAEAAFERDRTDNEYFPTTGGVQRFEVSFNEDPSNGNFAYWKYRLNVHQFFGLGEDRRKVIAVRGMIETNQERAGSQVPFFDLAAIGGSRTLRGFPNLRFQDRSALSLTAEYRYRIWRAMDWAFFIEGAQVAPELGDFGVNRFHAGYGSRLILKAAEKLPIIFDIAHGREGWRLHLNFGKGF